MIQKIDIKNFRNFSHREISFSSQRNIIIGNNGKWKSNILEALSLPCWPLVESHPEYLLRKWSDIFHIKYTLGVWTLAFSYDINWAKRKYFLWEKSTTKSKIRDNYPHVISFHPMMMNLMYLWPSHRRDFLDEILSQAFPEYQKILREYKKILTSRNRILKNISLWKSEISEIQFWDEKYITSASTIYKYRKKIIDFFSQKISHLQQYFFGKIEDIHFTYITKTDMLSPEDYLRKYIWENQNKEILLRKTLRWPHLDDFGIVIDGNPLIHFASRWEVKSILLGLKFLETNFLETHSDKSEILFLIDDLLSELDHKHRDILWEHIGSRQCVITSIEDFEVPWNKIYI